MGTKLEYDEEYYTYLDELRRSGITNMWGAAPYLKDAFDMDDITVARNILKDWQDTFADRREAGETGD